MEVEIVSMMCQIFVATCLVFKFANCKCSKGEYGVKNYCHDCPNGTTSFEGSALTQKDCFKPLNSTCKLGFFGWNGTCERCPDNSTSFDGAVKVQECKLKSAITCDASQTHCKLRNRTDNIIKKTWNFCYLLAADCAP